MDIATASAIVDTGLNALSTVGAGAILAAVLPKPGTNASKAYQVYLIVRKIVDFVGANWFNAKNGE